MFVKRPRAILIDRALYKYCIIIIIIRLTCYVFVIHYLITELLPSNWTRDGYVSCSCLTFRCSDGTVTNKHLVFGSHPLEHKASPPT